MLSPSIADPGVRVSAGPWWTQASALAASSTTDGHATRWYRNHYRLGDAVLELATSCGALRDDMQAHYGECATTAAATGLPRVRCTVSAIGHEGLALVEFDVTPPVDAFATALALLKHPLQAPLFIDLPETHQGWRLIVDAATGTPVVSARGSQVLIDWRHATLRVLSQLVVTPALAVQDGLLFAHAAALGLRGAGLMLVGPSGSGKTTAAVTLAARGHAFFGDDVAAIRVRSAELIAFWRTAHVRPGVHARAVAGHLANGVWDPPYRDGKPRLRMRVAELFGAADAGAAQALPLRRVLFLRKFADQPRIESFLPRPEHFGATSRFAFNNTLWVAWGTTPQRRLMQFMLFMRMLERVRCAWLDAGDPDATADLIETTQEDKWG